MHQSTTQFLPRPGGLASYEVSGHGPLVLCIPGMADLRSAYRFLGPALVMAGYRVAIIDLRGHGDSASTFDSYDNEANASDVAALIEHLGGPAVIVGNSMGAAIGALVAAGHPERVAGLALLGPFLRDGKVGGVLAAVMAVATSAPLVAATWKAYMRNLYKGTKPSDFSAYSREVVAGIKSHRSTVSRTMRTSHASAEAALPRVHTPVLVVMGELDPDFTSPRAEAEWIVGRLGGSLTMVPDAGHYPQSQRPELVTPAIIEFLATATHRA